MVNFDLEQFIRTAERIYQKASAEGRLTDNPTEAVLRRLLEKEPGCCKTKYNSFVAESEPTSRSAMFTKNSVDSTFGKDEQMLLSQCEEALAKERLVSLDRVVGNKDSDTIVRLIIPERFAHVAYGGGNLFIPPTKKVRKPTYTIIFFADGAFEKNRGR